MSFHLRLDPSSGVTGVHLVRLSSIETTQSLSQLCSCHLTDYNLPKVSVVLTQSADSTQLGVVLVSRVWGWGGGCRNHTHIH